MYMANIMCARFKLELFETTYCNTVTNTGEYSCLKVHFKDINTALSFNRPSLDCIEPEIAILLCVNTSFPLLADPDGVQERVLLLPPHNLRPLLYASHRFMGESHFESLPMIIFREKSDI